MLPVQVCDCGHSARQHAPSAKVRVTPRPCLVPDCECSQFRSVALATKIGQRDEPETAA